MLPLKALGEDPSLPLPSFWWFPASLGLRMHLSNLSPLSRGLLPLGVCVFVFSSYKSTIHVEFRACLNPV